MKFEDYCRTIDQTQKIRAENTFTLTYTNTRKEEFNISPESIKCFFNFFIDNYSLVENAWKNIDTRRDEIYQYEEKSYRAIYKTVNSEGMKAISAAGSSQTKALTQLISKIISFLAKKNYKKPEENTFFTIDNIKKCLENWDDLEKNSKHKKSNPVKSGIATTLPKQFLILAGLSGTGKTRFVREQAKSTGVAHKNYCLTSVRPDWHEPSDLLGYISRLNGTAEYITTDVLQFIANAWREIVDSGLTLDIQDTDENGERLVVLGERDILNQVLPYWLCLDEMNLAPVEQYFADYLSVLETREWYWEGDSFTYSSDALLKPATIKEVANTDKLRSALGFTEAEYDELWKYICQYGLAIPFNLMVAGTVNMDETTHGFSRKVIDRALSFDFGAFFPNDYDEFFSPTSFHKRLSYPIWSHASKEEVDFEIESQTGEQIKAGDTTIQFLKVVNSVLKNTPFELAYRALNELLLSVISVYPKDELSLKAVWDDFIMCKVLPRIEGDIDKLTTSDGKEILAELSAVLEIQLAPIWNSTESDVSTMRPDLYREKTDVEGLSDKEKILRIPCRSKDKIEWMGQRLTNSSFTSFWP
ncbi:hypothetical protein RVM27_08940 [Halomonas sp. KM007]